MAEKKIWSLVVLLMVNRGKTLVKFVAIQQTSATLISDTMKGKVESYLKKTSTALKQYSSKIEKMAL